MSTVLKLYHSIAPTVTVTADENTLYDTNSTILHISAEASCGIKKVELYKNDKLFSTIASETGDIIFSEEEGTYSIYAIAYDNNNCFTKSDVISLSVLRNMCPVIAVTGISNDESYSPEQISDINISITDDDALEAVEVYVGASLLRQTSDNNFNIDLSSLNYGRHLISITAYDILGGKTEQKIIIVVAPEAMMEVSLSNDFEKYVDDSGEKNPSGLSFTRTADAKIYSASNYGAEHGRVAVFGSEGKLVDDKTASGSWGRFTTTGTKNGFEIECDINAFTNNNSFAFFLYDATNKIGMNYFVIANGEMQISNDRTKDYKSVPFPENEWHTLKFFVDIIKHRISAWVDGTQVAEDYVLRSDIITVDTRLILTMDTTNPQPCRFAFDNLTISYMYPSTQITAIGYDDIDACTIVNPKAENLTFTLNTALEVASIHEQSVILLSDDREMPYKSVSYDEEQKSITIFLSERLKSECGYCLELNSMVHDANKMALTNNLKCNFETGLADFDVESIQFVNENNRTKAVGKIKNSDSEDKTCYAILNIFNGNKPKSTSVVKIEVDANSSAPFETDLLDCAADDTAEIYFIEDFVSLRSIRNSFFKK